MHSSLSGDIPLVGRGALLAAVEEVVSQDDVFGALIMGDTGTGKTALARHLLEHTDDDVVPFLVTSASALSRIPYGALGPFLAASSAADMASPLAVLRTVLAFFRSRTSPGQTVLVIVDDAHLLDDASSHLLAQLVTSRTVTLVAFARPLAPASDELVSLGRDGLLEKFDVGPLGYEEALELCTLILGAGIVRGASDRLCDEASGNPLFLKAIIDEALAQGALTRPDGVWTLASGELHLPAALTDLVRAVILELDDAETTVLELLSLGEVVSFTDLVRVGGERAVSRLLNRGLIRTYPEAAAYAVHTHPLFGRIIRSQVPVGRSVLLRSEVASTGTPSRPLPDRARLRGALWSLECGEPVPEEALLDLAGLALRRLDGQTALRLVASVTSEDQREAARLVCAGALLQEGRLEEARSTATGLLDRAASPELVSMAGSLEVRLALASGEDFTAVEAVVERWSEALASLPDSTDPRELRESHRERRVAEIVGLNHAGRYSEAIVFAQALIAEGSSSTSADLRTVVLAHAALAEALTAVGRTAEGRHHGVSALTLIDQHPQPMLDVHRLAFSAYVSLLMHSGDLPEAKDALAAYTPGEGSDYSFTGGSLAVLSGAVEVRSGRFRSGLDILRPAIASLRVFDPAGLLPYALGTAAWAAAAIGDADLFAQAEHELHHVEHHGPRQYGLLARAFRTAGRMLLGTATAGEALLHFAAEAGDLGWLSCEKDILEIATSLGTEQAAARLALVTRAIDGTEADVLHQYATALLEQDAEALAEAGERAELFQKYLLAADACVRAMDAYALAGDAKSQRALAPVARRRRGMIDGSVMVEPVDLGGITPLTSREREIASLALQGLTNRDIARVLTVSTRTVEGHLYRIYVKLGISRRDELTAELEPLLRGT